MKNVIGRGHPLTEVEFGYIKQLLAQGYTTSQVANLSRRGHSTVGLIFNSKTFAEYATIKHKYYQNVLQPLTNSDTSSPAVPRVWPSGMIVKVEEDFKPGNVSKLSQAIELLEKEFESLKTAITEVIVLGVEEKVKDKIAEFEALKAENNSLKQVVNAAKSSNWTDNIKSRVFGDV